MALSFSGSVSCIFGTAEFHMEMSHYILKWRTRTQNSNILIWRSKQAHEFVTP